MPGARNWMIVAMKLTAPSSDDVIRNTMPMSQNVCPSVGIDVASGEYEVQPAWAGAARDEEAGQHDHAAEHIGLVARHVDAREGHVRRADLQRHDVVAERREGQRHDGHETP